MTGPELIARLRARGDGEAASRLADVFVTALLARPLPELVNVRAATRTVRDALLAATQSEGASRRLEAVVAEGKALVSEHADPLGAALPEGVRVGLKSLVALPLIVPRDAATRLLDRPSVRALLRAQIVRTLSDFGRRAASPVADSTLAKGLGGLGKLAGQIARPGALGAIASAVSGEVERQVERRAADFADTAVAGVLAGIAEQLSQPAHAAEQSLLRQELVEGLLAMRGSELAATLAGDPAAAVEIGRRAARALAEDDAFWTRVDAWLAAQLARDAQRTLGDLLEELGLRAVVESTARRLSRSGMTLVFESEAFATWLSGAVYGPQ